MTSRLAPNSARSHNVQQHSRTAPKALSAAPRRHANSNSSSSCRRARSCCHATSPQQQRQQQQQQDVRLQKPAASPSAPVQQQDYPLVERMFDHNWRSPLAGHDHPDPSCRPVLALGKFDALHKGHQALAAAALQLGGSPVLLSFSGMAAVLGWAPRKPLVAPCDRPRVLHLWAHQLAAQRLEQQQRKLRRKRPLAEPLSDNAPGAQPDPTISGSSSSVAPVAATVQQAVRQQAGDEVQQAVQVVPVRQRYIPFAAVRSLSPEAFVDHISSYFRAAGVVSGSNYRFGYRAAGDSALLQQLCGAAGLPVAVVEMVGAATPGAVGPVSSTKIREMLDSCRIEAVKRSLGRPYRLVAEVSLLDWQQQQLRGYQSLVTAAGAGDSSSSSSSSSGSTGSSQSAAMLHPGWVLVPAHQLLNQQPAPGVFLCHLQLFVGACAHDDLLQLQQAVSGAGADSSGYGVRGSSSSLEVVPLVGSSSSRWCVRASQQQVEVVPDGVLVPQAVWEAAESCFNNAAAGRTGSSSSSRERGTDPLVWDTDDRGSGDDVGDEASLSALLVLDLESCMMQMCTFS